MTDSNTHSSPGWTPPTVEELHALLPQYEISAVLGQGGMGAVYKGRQTNLKRNVAIKILPESFGDEDEHLRFVERFKLEAQSMANLDHPAILSVYDFGETAGDQLYIVMEFIDGMDIEAYLHHHGGKLVREHAIAITAHVLDALRYAHDHGVVHRDIKPANVLINSEGRVKIADFGLAKRLTHGEDGGEPETGLTSANVVMGTPDFVAPEALEIGTNPDGRADLYSVGVMFYQMLTGKLPRGQFEIPSQLQPDLDPRFDAVVSKALQANPESRYGSAAEFRTDLNALRSKFVPPATGSKPGKVPVVRRTKVPVQSRLPYPRPKLAEPKKSKAPLLIGLALGATLVIGVGIYATTRPETGKEGTLVVIPSEPPPQPSPNPAPSTEPIPEPEPTLNPEPEPIPEPTPDPEPAPIPEPKPEPTPEPEPKPNPHAELAAIPGLEKRLDGYLKVRGEQIGSLAANYQRGLETRLSQATSDGDLKLARAYDEEKTRVADLRRSLGEPPADPFSAVEQTANLSDLPEETPEAVTALRVTWDAERQKIRDDLDGKLIPSLEALEVELTQARALDQAEDVLAFRESLNLASPVRESEPFAGSKAGQEMENALGMKLCWIPPGQFTMGSPEDEAGREPGEAQRDVTLKREFWIGKYEVTQAEYEEVTEINPSEPKEASNRAPVTMVNWDSAMNFCKELTERERKMGRLPEGWTYTLPTEAQWEYACRAGEKGPFSGGKPDEVAWHEGNAGGTTHPVGEKLANPWGLHDMHGNVWEWCQDWYGSSFPEGVLIDPQGPATGSNRVMRGGSFARYVGNARCARRNSYAPGRPNQNIGFRVILAPGQP